MSPWSSLKKSLQTDLQTNHTAPHGIGHHKLESSRAFRSKADSRNLECVAQQKTGTRLWVPIHSELQSILDATPSDHLTYLISGNGKPYSSAGTFSHAVNRWAKQAGLTGCPLHGLRKSCLTRLAEAGCSAVEIMAVSGHKSLAEVERYVKAAEQKHMAERAIARTEVYPRADRAYPEKKA